MGIRGCGAEHFQPARDLLNTPGRYDPEDEHASRAFTQQFHVTLIAALQDLEADGFFGVGDAREKVTVFVTECNGSWPPPR